MVGDALGHFWLWSFLIFVVVLVGSWIMRSGGLDNDVGLRVDMLVVIGGLDNSINYTEPFSRHDQDEDFQ